MLYEYSLKTPSEGLLEISNSVRDAIRRSGVKTGIAVIYCPHTTAGITINENADDDVKHDFLLGLEKTFPDDDRFTHFEGNSSAHLKSSSVGVSKTIIINDAMPMLGRWQGVYFCEFDGPRDRKYFVRVISG